MSREFSKISPKVWQSKRFRALASDDARFLHLFLLTSPHQSSAGCFKMPDAYAAADLRWPVDRMLAARRHIIDAGLVAFDAETEEYFVCGWFGHNKPMNANHQKAIRKLVDEIESDNVREVAAAELEAALVHTWISPANYGGLANSRLVRAG